MCVREFLFDIQEHNWVDGRTIHEVNTIDETYILIKYIYPSNNKFITRTDRALIFYDFIITDKNPLYHSGYLLFNPRKNGWNISSAIKKRWFWYKRLLNSVHLGLPKHVFYYCVVFVINYNSNFIFPKRTQDWT